MNYKTLKSYKWQVWLFEIGSSDIYYCINRLFRIG